jgi:hypothetical protein
MQSNMIWSQRRKWMGNLLPLFLGMLAFLLALPFNVPWMSKALLVLAVVYLSINQFGFFQNESIRKELMVATNKGGELVGFVHLNPSDALDAHAEVGLLHFGEDGFIVDCQNQTYEYTWDKVTYIKRSKNIHWWIGLGGWIEIGLEGTRPFKIESRLHDKMLKSKLRTNKLFEEIKRLAPSGASQRG